MLFLKNKHSGDYIEIQYCRLPVSRLKELVSVDNISHWKEDSLFVADENIFYSEYGDIFTDGIYNNLGSGEVDLYGINYYSPAVLPAIAERIIAHKPMEYEVLLEWLKKAENCNGFYILGV